MSDVLTHSALDVPTRALGWALIQFVWQGTLIASIAAVVLAALRHRTASVRYLVATSALALMFVTAAGTMVWYAEVPELKVETPTATARASMPVAGGFLPALDPPEIRLPPTSSDEVSLRQYARNALSRDRIERWMPTMVLLWLGGVLALSLNLMRGWLMVMRIRRSAQPTIGAWGDHLQQLVAHVRLSRPVTLVESALVEVPAVIGWLRPMILLPASALTGLSTKQIEAVLAHELAHIRRHDYLVNLLQSLVETLLFFHPAVWWISKRIRTEREHCCDDVAVAVCGDRVAYLRALMHLEERRHSHRSLALAMSDGPLVSRFQRILNASPPEHPGAGWIAVVLAIALGATTLTWEAVGERVSTSGSRAANPSQVALDTDRPTLAPMPPLASGHQAPVPGAVEPGAAPSATLVKGRGTIPEEAPMITMTLLANLLASLQITAPSTPARSSDCARVQALGPGVAVTEVCKAEEELGAAQRMTRSDPQRQRRLSAAADLYRRALGLISDTEIKAHLLNRLADLYDAEHLNDARQVETTLRDLVNLQPAETGPLYRLADFQEKQQQLDGAEGTLMSAKQLRPNEIEPYKRLAQFYARRATALNDELEQAKRASRPQPKPGVPDKDGIYNPGGDVSFRVREGVPQYPPEARAAGVTGPVIVEALVNEQGVVTSARVLRSVPLLDDAALNAVRVWRFQPTVMNGRPVPVRLNLVVNFPVEGVTPSR
jgi:TonB family protein